MKMNGSTQQTFPPSQRRRWATVRSRGARASLALVAAAALAVTSVSTAEAANPSPNPNALELANAQLSRSAAEQGMVLMENHGHALPLQKKTDVALFGVGAYATVKGGTGSGNVNNRYTINVRTGLENAGFKVTTSSAYWDAMVNAYDHEVRRTADRAADLVPRSITPRWSSR